MLYSLVSGLLLFSLFLSLSTGTNITVPLYWHGGKIAPGCDVCAGGVNTSDYACSYGNRGDWNNGYKWFMDPLPFHSTITQVVAVLVGAFDCMDLSSEPAQVTLTLQRQSVDSILPQSLPCYCGNCVTPCPVTMNGIQNQDWPGYIHGGNNTFQVVVTGNNQICLNRVDLIIEYTIVPPSVNYIFPTSGPVSGGTVVTVYGSNFSNSSNVDCSFGTNKSNAIVLDPSRVVCFAPGSGVGEVTFNVQSGNLSAIFASMKPYFLYYIPPLITTFQPQQGPVEGGTFITLTGHGFFNSNETVTCEAINRLNTSATVLVALYPNGQQAIVFGKFTFDDPKNNTLMYIYLAVGIFVGMLAIVLLCTVLRRRYTRKGYQKIKDIKLGRRIGKGNFGEVYLGVWCGTEVAIKKLPAHNLTEQLLKDFQKEVALLKALRHPNVLQFVGSCMVLPDIFICTEYMSRGSLYDVLHNQDQPEISWQLIKKMIIDAARGCLYLHSFVPMIIHRDLKSHNLLVDDTWKVKVCDFGLSTVTETQNRQMTACGTPCWTAPEILRNQPYSEKADIFSFGVVMWECATRMDPFVGMPPFQVIFAVGREGMRLPDPQSTPLEYVKLMKECWDETPSKRPSMAEIMERLEALDVSGYPPIPAIPSPNDSPAF